MVDAHRPSQKSIEFKKRGEDILQQAQALFMELGEDKVTVEMIADKVGIGKGTIYKHFHSKDEIYLRLMIRYEEELAEVFSRLETSADEDRTKLAQEYFRFRMGDPDKYALFDRLEHKLTAGNSVPELVARLHEIRASNMTQLTGIIQKRIAEGSLDDVPPYYHVFAAWALVHGAVALHHSKFYQGEIKDKEGFFNWLAEVGIRMGNKRPDKPAKE